MSKKILLSVLLVIIIGFALFAYFNFVNTKNGEPVRQNQEIR